MRHAVTFLLVGISLNVLIASVATGQGPPDAVKSAGTAPAQQTAGLPRRFETNHQGTFGGQQLRYKAVVAEDFIPGSSGKRTASIFTTSYIRTDISRKAQCAL